MEAVRTTTNTNFVTPAVMHSGNDSKKDSSGSPLFIQPKLTIGAADDPLEKEADDMADKVMRMPMPEPISFSTSKTIINRKCSECEKEEELQRKESGSETLYDKVMRMPSLEPIIFSPSKTIINRKCAECEKEEELQRKESNSETVFTAPSIVQDVLNSPGRSLDTDARSFMESRFNYDFSNVKIHDNHIAAKSASSINALAYTSGNNVVFNSGQYNTNSDSGKRLLAHELTHVVQQSRKTIEPTVQKQGNQKQTNQKPTNPACPMPGAIQIYSRGNDDWLECSYETAQIMIQLTMDPCGCSSPDADMPIAIDYFAVLLGKSQEMAPDLKDPDADWKLQEEGEASYAASGVETPGRFSGVDPQTGIYLSDGTNKTGPLRLTVDDARGGKPGDPGDTLTQVISLGTIKCNKGGKKSGEVEVRNDKDVYQTIKYSISEKNKDGILPMSLSLTESKMPDRVKTKIRNLTAGEKRYPPFPGTVRPRAKGACKCNPITGRQEGKCNLGAGGSGVGKP